MAVETAHLDAGRFKALLGYDFSQRSLYDVLTEHGVALTWADQWIEAMAAPVADAALLGVPRSSALLRIERTSYDAADHPLEFVTSLYRADRYRFNVRLERDTGVGMNPSELPYHVMDEGR